MSECTQKTRQLRFSRSATTTRIIRSDLHVAPGASRLYSQATVQPNGQSTGRSPSQSIMSSLNTAIKRRKLPWSCCMYRIAILAVVAAKTATILLHAMLFIFIPFYTETLCIIPVENFARLLHTWLGSSTVRQLSKSELSTCWTRCHASTWYDACSARADSLGLLYGLTLCMHLLYIHVHYERNSFGCR